MKRILLLLALVLLLIPTLAQAQFSAGDWDFTLTGAGLSDKEFDSTSANFGLTLGHFITNEIEVNVRQTVGFADTESSSSEFTGTTAVGADLHFPVSDKLVPFIGAATGYRYGDLTEDGWYVVPEGGVKYFVNDTTYVFGSVGFQFDVDDGFDDGAWVYGLGVGFRW